MTNHNEPLHPIVQRASTHPVVRYATWGLIGVGALVVLRWALTLLLNPFLLILLVGGGALAWSTLRKREQPDARPSAVAAAAEQPLPAEIEDPVARSQAELDAFDRRLAEIEKIRAEQQRTVR